MRLFVAVELTEDARTAIAREQQRLKAFFGRGGGRSELKWVSPDHMHLTLTFLGEIPEPTAEPVIQAMGEPFAVEPFTIEFGDLGVFPSFGPPRVLWLGVARGERAVIDLQGLVSARLERVDIVPETRPFHPHLTLARWRTSRSADRRHAEQAGDGRSIAELDVRSVALVHSRLSSAGPTYTTLALARLGESAAPPLQSSE